MLSAVQNVTEAHEASRQKMVSSLRIYSLEIIVATESWAEVRSLCKVCTWIEITQGCMDPRNPFLSFTGADSYERHGRHAASHGPTHPFRLCAKRR